MKKIYLALFILPITLGACRKQETSVTGATGTSGIHVPAGFNWQTSRNVSFNIGVTSDVENGMTQVISIYDADPALDGKLIARGGASKETPFNITINLASTLKEVFIVKKTPGLEATTEKVNIADSKVSLTLDINASARGTKGTRIMTGVEDTDGDGIEDSQDLYPEDATRSLDSYFPSKDTYSTLAFEDNWPEKGDFDFNDLIIDYNYKIVSNGKNELTELIATYELKATGAVFGSAFAVELPVDVRAVTDVSGASLEESNGKAVITVFTNSRAQIGCWNTGGKVDSLIPSKSCSSGTKKFTVKIAFNEGVSASSLNLGYYNPFIYHTEDGKPGRNEIHLAGEAPTSGANTEAFGTRDDDSNLSTGVFYKTKEGLPWALNIPTGFAYPKEETDITKVYLKFSNWAQSGGSLDPDWYSNTESGYQDTENLYK